MRLPGASIMCVVSHTTFVSLQSDQRKAVYGRYGLFFRETRNAVRTVRTVRYSYPRVMLPQLPPWTGGCHIMPTHAGKCSIPPGLLSDLLVVVRGSSTPRRSLDTSETHNSEETRAGVTCHRELGNCQSRPEGVSSSCLHRVRW